MSSLLIASTSAIINRSLLRSQFKVASDHFFICRIGACTHFNHCLIFYFFLKRCSLTVIHQILNVYKKKRYKRLAIVPTEKDVKSQWSVTRELVHKIISFFHLSIRKCPRRNKFNDKGSISVHRSNKDCSSTYNIASISCHLPAIYHFDVLALS
jgi:hypothetical protein